jgi:hypothetical protein
MVGRAVRELSAPRYLRHLVEVRDIVRLAVLRGLQLRNERGALEVGLLETGDRVGRGGEKARWCEAPSRMTTDRG